MAHAIEGYSRLNTGQTIQIKNQKKSTPASKPQTIKKNSSNVGGAVYTASRFEDVAKNKSTYTAKATYTNPVLAKKQSTITQVAQSNKEAAKTSPNALTVAKNFFGGVVDAGVSTAVSLYNLGRHPVQTAKAVGTVIAHPVQTAEAIKEIAVELKDDFKEGNADVKAHMIGRAVGEIGLAIAGAKAVDIGAKALKTFKAAQATANGGKAGVVAEKLSEASKAADAVVDVTEKVADKTASVGKVTSKSLDLEITNDGITAASKTQKHHIATDKNKKFDFKNHPVFKETGIDISKDIDNFVDLANHRGRHTDAYHKEVQRRLDAVYDRFGGTDKLESAVRSELNAMKQELLDGTLNPYRK